MGDREVRDRGGADRRVVNFSIVEDKEVGYENIVSHWACQKGPKWDRVEVRETYFSDIQMQRSDISFRFGLDQSLLRKAVDGYIDHKAPSFKV